MKVRSVSNGNIIDLPEDHGLVVAGIYVPATEADEQPAEGAADAVFTPSPRLEEALVQPEAEVMTTAHLGAASKARAPKADTQKKAARPRGRRK